MGTDRPSPALLRGRGCDRGSPAVERCAGRFPGRQRRKPITCSAERENTPGSSKRIHLKAPLPEPRDGLSAPERDRRLQTAEYPAVRKPRNRLPFPNAREPERKLARQQEVPCGLFAHTPGRDDPKTRTGQLRRPERENSRSPFLDETLKGQL